MGFLAAEMAARRVRAASLVEVLCDARRRWWRWRYELTARPPQPCREYPAGEPVERHDRPVATSGTAEVYVPAGVPVEMGVVRVVDDEPARAREHPGAGVAPCAAAHERDALQCRRRCAAPSALDSGVEGSPRRRAALRPLGGWLC